MRTPAILPVAFLATLSLACGDKDGGGSTGDTGSTGGDDSGEATVEPGPCEGDRLVTDSDSYAALVAEQCTSISGTLALSGVPAVDLGLLTQVGADLSVDDTGGINTLLLPSLETVGGTVAISGTVLQDLELPSLTTVTSSVSITMADDGAELALGLVSVGGDLTIRGGVTAVDLDALTTVDKLRVDGTGAAPALSLSAAEQIGALGNDSDPMVLSRLVAPNLAVVGGALGVAMSDGTLELPALQQVWGACVVEGVDGGPASVDLAGLFDVGAQVELRGTFDGTATIDLSSLQNTGGDVEITADGVTGVDLSGLETTGAAFRVEGTDVLSDLDASALGLVGGNLEFVDNTALPTCTAVEIVNQVGAAGGVGGGTTVSGNLADECAI